MNWWDRMPWADRERVGIRLAWASVLVTVLALLAYLLNSLL
jgi:hypothetical protein